MPLLVQQSSSGVRKSKEGVYQAVGTDPRFSYRFWLRRPRYFVVLLEGIDECLDPKLYADRGNGFDEETSIALNYQAGPCIYCIKMTPPRQVRRLRIDPCSSEVRFRYWAGLAWSEGGLANLLNQAKAVASQSASASCVKIYHVAVNGTAEKRRRRDSTKSIADHFAAVVALAMRTAPPIHQMLKKDKPLISFIIPVFNTPERYLDELLDSWREQLTGVSELILCDDGSTSPTTLSWLNRHESALNVRVIHNERNCGIAVATNTGLEAARGTWVGLIDHDDALTPCAVQFIAQTIQDHPNCQFIYTDEIVTDEKLKPVGYHFKPAYDEVLLSGVNYINHLSCYRRERLLALGGLRTGYDGSQDYDLLLRYLRDLNPEEIKHLPYPAYRWRRTGRTFSTQLMEQATANARKALAERYKAIPKGQQGLPVDEAITKTLHRVRFDKVQAVWPFVSIVIPSRDAFPLISRVLADLTKRTDYPNFEIVVVDNGSTDERVLALYAEYEEGAVPFRYEIESAPFNFSRQVNRGIALAQGDFILLLNNDIEAIDCDWLREMVCCFSYPSTGVVGAKLLYPNGRIQHAGVIVGLGGLAGHRFDGARKDFPGPMAQLHVRQSLTAVTGACMLISRACLNAIGGFDESELGIAYNDIDFCLRAVAAGFRTVWTPFATLVHRESASRGSDEAKANRTRFARDKATLRRRHGTDSYEDRAFSPWYGRNGGEPVFLMSDRIPRAR